MSLPYSLGYLLKKLCDTKYYNVTQKYIQDIYDIALNMARANVSFDGK